MAESTPKKQPRTPPAPPTWREGPQLPTPEQEAQLVKKQQEKSGTRAEQEEAQKDKRTRGPIHSFTRSTVLGELRTLYPFARKHQGLLFG